MHGRLATMVLTTFTQESDIFHIRRNDRINYEMGSVFLDGYKFDSIFFYLIIINLCKVLLKDSKYRLFLRRRHKGQVPLTSSMKMRIYFRIMMSV